MRGELLLDTGALVSLLDRSQTHHLKCRRAFADWTGPVVSTEAVLTEATHLLAGVQGGRAACVDFFLSGGALLVPSSSASLQRVRKLLDKYADLPMDFADATLVALAEELDCTSVFTTDRYGFFGLQDQRPEALSYPAERLSRPERSSRVGGHETVARRVSDVKVCLSGTRPVARHSRTVSWAIRLRRGGRVSPGPRPSR